MRLIARTASPPAATEQEVVAALAAALAPIRVWWGYGPFETAELPPSLPLVVVVRTAATVRTDWADMCEDDALPADTTLQLRVWHTDYPGARTLNAQARDVMRGLVGWVEQLETDVRDGDFHAWVIASDWTAQAIPLV
jgi:hypothetical protein